MREVTVKRPLTELERFYAQQQAVLHEQLRSVPKPTNDNPFDEFDMLFLGYPEPALEPGRR